MSFYLPILIEFLRINCSVFIQSVCIISKMALKINRKEKLKKGSIFSQAYFCGDIEGNN